MTNEQLAACIAFGLLIVDHKESLLEYMTIEELRQLAADADVYLSPQISDEQDMVTPIITVLREAIQQVKE